MVNVEQKGILNKTALVDLNNQIGATAQQCKTLLSPRRPFNA